MHGTLVSYGDKHELDGARAATRIIAEFSRVLDPIQDSLVTSKEQFRGRGKAETRQHSERIDDLCGTIVQLYEDLGC